MNPNLFCYGTLEFENVIKRIIGRVPSRVSAQLIGFERKHLVGVPYPAIVRRKDGQVTGSLYRTINKRELRLLDGYEGAMYIRRRVVVRLAGARPVVAWTYVLNRTFAHRVQRLIPCNTTTCSKSTLR